MCDIYSEASKRNNGGGGFLQGRNFVNPKYFFLSLSRQLFFSLFLLLFSFSKRSACSGSMIIM